MTTVTPPWVLLVEDEGFVRQVAGEILRSAGYEVRQARDAAEAMTLFQERGDFDLLLTDLVLPGKNGRELARELSVLRPGLKIIYISGYPHPPLPNEEDGPALYLPKPFSAEVLVQRVGEALAHTTAPAAEMAKAAACSG